MGKTIMVFGVFDRLHSGHRYFLEAARKEGDRLVVVVARDTAVMFHKNKSSIESQAQRMARVREIEYVDEVVLGDDLPGSYDIVQLVKPDCICLGYDQDALGDSLLQRMSLSFLPLIEMKKLEPYRPEEFHSSILE